MSPLALFVAGLGAGLVAGGFSCAVTQAGLLAGAVSAGGPGRRLSSSVTPVAVFLSAKLVAHTALGVALGLVGAVLQPTPLVRALLLMVAGAAMLLFALDLAGVRAAGRLLPGSVRHCPAKPVDTPSTGRLRAAILLGLSTVFVPCGVTLSVEVLAVTSRSALGGGAVMAGFVIGTAPVFGVLGVAVGQTLRVLSGRLTKLAAFALVVIAVWTFGSGLRVAGWWPQPSGRSVSDARIVAMSADGTQTITIGALNSGYRPAMITAHAGAPTVLVLSSRKDTGCTRVFLIPSRGVQVVLPVDGDTRIDLGTPPPGRIGFTCAMGMYAGQLTFR